MADQPENREKQIFSAALDYATPAERAAYLDEACGDDVALRARVAELLRVHEVAGGFLADNDSTVGSGGNAGPAESAATEADLTGASISEGPGTRIGRYKLIKRIGEGGFGVVYLAEQEEPVRRQVALKIIKLGMDTRAVIARFEAERQALAMMDHPNISKVLDGGATETGRPYFVMELVEGVPITTFCDEHRLTMSERIELFSQVCRAVQHAHQKGVIHRDLKPSNILVALHDDRPVPKVIDFGIAKAMDRTLTEKTIFTRYHQVIGTPAYMSPEQTGLNGLDVDTRSDIYTLGVLLYELLTGRTPFDPQTLLKAGYDEIHRVIREKDPPTPSTRLALLSREDQTAAAQCRRLEPAALTSGLRGDLDRIVMKCLEKDRIRRYDTANGLAMDLGRYLRDEPVLARPEALAYHAAKFVRRHRTAVTFALVIVAALAVGLVGTVIQAQRAARQAARAEAEKHRADEAARVANEQRDFALRQLSRADAINDLNAFLLSDAAASGKPFTATDLLARAERILDRESADTGENRVEILVSLGRQYATLDERGKARALLAKAYELSRNLTDHGLRAEAAAAYANEIAIAGEFDRAEVLIRDALAELGDDPRYASHRVFCLALASHVAREGGRVQEGLERILTAQRILRETGDASALQELRVAMDVAESYRMAGQHRAAVEEFEKAFAQLTALGRDDTDRAGTLLNNWAISVLFLGRPLEAERLYRRAVAISTTGGTDDGVSPMLLNNLARVLVELGRIDEAADFADRAHEKAVRMGAEMVVNQNLHARASIYLERGDFVRAAAMIDEVERRWRRMVPADHISFAIVASLRSQLALAEGNFPVAIVEADRALELAERSAQAADRAPLMRLRRAQVEVRMGRLDPAQADAQKTLVLFQKNAGPGSVSSDIGLTYLTLGQIHAAQGKTDEARAAFGAALKHLAPTLGADHPKTREAAQGAAGLDRGLRSP